MQAASHLKSTGKPDAAGPEAKATLKRWSRIGPALVGAAMLGACASASSDGAGDPLEPMNRAVFVVNDVLDQAVLRPVSYVYKEALPDPIKDVVRNFLRWLKSPVILANDFLQGNFAHAKVTSARLLVNGALFGTVEIAEGLGLPYREEDFGQTLGVHGVSEGAYLMLPLLGPSNVRDTVGLLIDYFVDPFSYLDRRGLRQSVGIGRGAIQAVNFRAENFDRIDGLRSYSIDYYAKVRAIYRQQRKAAINNGVISIDDSTPDLSEEFDRQLPTPEAEAPLSKPGG